MAAVLPLPAVGIEDFALHREEAGTPPLHSRDQTFSSPPAPPLSTALSPDTQDYSFSSNIYDDYAASRSTSAHEDEYTTEDDDLAHLHAPVVAQSNRSSISSFPGSILPDSRQDRLSTPSKSLNPLSHPDVLHHGRSGSLSHKIRSPGSRLRDGDRNVPMDREYVSGFRNPSSVRAMQMRDEEPFNSDPDSTPHHQRSGSRTSNFSRRSANASPTKRPSRSSHSTPHKVSSPSKLKKEFPLVLLHCSLLPPTLALNTHITDEALMEEILPAEYWRRWKTLQDKVGEDNEIRTRGVLIPHPREDYDVLEERLLESLELERARLRKGHYIAGATDVDSGVGTESERDTENESDVEGYDASAGPKPPKCPDCGKRVPKETEVDRKWEVKVYAANGLMRAGAWAAAWSEMEKVDIEVSVWMPEVVRRQVDARLKELGVFDSGSAHQEHNDSFVETEEERRQREIYGRHSQVGETTDGLSGERSHHILQEDVQINRGPHPDHLQQQPDLQSLTFRYIQQAMQDRRNIFMALLSILVLFLAVSNPSATKEMATLQPDVSANPEIPVTMTSVSILTSTAIVTATVVTTTSSSTMPSQATASILSSLTSSTADSNEKSSATSTELTEPIELTELNVNAPQPITSTFSSHEDEETPVIEQLEPMLLEQMV